MKKTKDYEDMKIEGYTWDDENWKWIKDPEPEKPKKFTKIVRTGKLDCEK